MSALEEIQDHSEDYLSDELLFPSTTVGQEIYVRGLSAVLFEIDEVLSTYPIPTRNQTEQIVADWSGFARKVRELAFEARRIERREVDVWELGDKTLYPFD